MKTNTLTTPQRSPARQRYVCSLESAGHDEGCGGKATHLGRMVELGIPVPPGLVVTDGAFQAFLDENQLRTPISAALAGLQPSRTEDLEAASQAIRGHIMTATIPASILASIHESLVELLPGATLVVRSSAIGEDSRQAAFAGQLDSFLDINSEHALEQALLACWASYWSQRSLFYQLSRGIHLRGMGVVIQEQVASRISGILFTRGPESSSWDGDALVVEYCFGLGDELAAGRLNPGRFVISRQDFRWRKLAAPEQENGDDDAWLFNDDQILRLSRASLTLEEQFGDAQDIEWTIDRDGRLYLVQSRPITVPAAARPGTGVVPGNRSLEALCLSRRERPTNAGLEALCLSRRERPTNAGLEALCLSRRERPTNAGLEALCLSRRERPTNASLEALCLSRRERPTVEPRRTHPDSLESGDDHASCGGPSVVWSNANVNENFPQPISPFLYSIARLGYYHYFRNLGLSLGIHPDRAAAMESPLRGVIGVHGGRMYYNLTNIHALLRMAPGGALLSQWFNSFVGADQTPGGSDAGAWNAARRNRVSRLLEAARIGRKTTWQFLFLSQRVTAFERTIDEFAARTSPELLDDKPLSELLEDLRSFMDIRCHRWTNASLADTAAMVSYGILKRMLNGAFPDHDQSGLHNSLLKGVGDVVSGVPIAELWSLSRMVRQDDALRELLAASDDGQVFEQLRANRRFARFCAALDGFLDNWGFRCSGELMLTVPSFQEQPRPLLDMLRAYVCLEGDSPLELLQRQASERVAETARVFKDLRRRKLLWPLPWPNQASLTAIVLAACHKSIALRERARLKQALLYSRCRRIALAIADKLVPLGLLDRREDVFYLTFQELDSLLAGSEMFPYQTKELVRLRKTGHQQLSDMSPADAFELPAGAYLRLDSSNRPARHEASNGCRRDELVGVGACGGQVTAPAAILTDVSECRLLSEGDVLVTRQTDPGWGPVFFLIKGLVMERGGMLSHGAILAREYGIPTVVGVPNATQRISPGQNLCVNGDRGVVQLAD